MINNKDKIILSLGGGASVSNAHIRRYLDQSAIRKRPYSRIPQPGYLRLEIAYLVLLLLYLRLLLLYRFYQ